MRILIIGSGGREHALTWKLSQSTHVDKIFVAPGNAGTLHEKAVNIEINANDIDALVSFAKKEKIDLVIPGPELPLTLGITDKMQKENISCFGPDKFCAQMEASKTFAKEIMQKANVPTGKYIVCHNENEANKYLLEHEGPIVVKADGLAAGKGVIVAKNKDEAINSLKDIFKSTNSTKILLEEFLEGEEVSLLCLCDGKHAIPLPSAQDHKAVFDNDMGPNTGGMGAYSPAPILPDDKLEEITDLVIRPILKELSSQNHPFIGILYAGLMITKNGPKVLEYNVRFGDPECQALMLRLNNDLYEIISSCINGSLNKQKITFNNDHSLGIVLTASGYPAKYNKGMSITGIEQAEKITNVKVFHSGTMTKDNTLCANGGRVLCITALANTLKKAQENAYSAIKKIHMADSYYRKDIGNKGIARLKEGI